MKLCALHSLYVEDLSFPILEEEEESDSSSDSSSDGAVGGNRKDTDTPAGKAIGSAGGEGAVHRKSKISAPMISHLKKPKGHKDHRDPSVGTLKRLRNSGVDIKQVVPELFK